MKTIPDRRQDRIEEVSPVDQSEKADRLNVTVVDPDVSDARHFAKARRVQAYPREPTGNNAFWSDMAFRYGESLRATASTHWVRAASLRRLKKIVRPNDSILEIGCGNASSLLGPLSQVCQTFGVDLTEEMLLLAKRNYSAVRGFVRADACQLPLQDDSFDLVYTSRCLINLPNSKMQLEAIREAFRVARPSGTVVLIENFEEPIARMRPFVAGGAPADKHNLRLNLCRTLDFCQSLDWYPVRTYSNTLASFLANAVVGRIPHGQAVFETLFYPLFVSLTWIEDALGTPLPLFGKDNMIVLKKGRERATLQRETIAMHS